MTGAQTIEVRGDQPRSLIVTVYGLYAREVGGWLSIASLIRLLAGLGVDEASVRSSISRLKRRGVLEAQRADGAAGYALSKLGRALLDEGDLRIFGRTTGTVSDGWVVAVFSVPESERGRRHLLRSQLAWLGFGTVSAGVWVAPSHRYAQARRSIEELGLAGYVDLFRSDYLGFADLRSAVASWWDIEGLQTLYEDFTRAHTPMLTSWRKRRKVDSGLAFADYVRALTQWRRLPYLDPGLPAELLPSPWHGARATEVFLGLQDLLRGAAASHVRDVTSP